MSGHSQFKNIMHRKGAQDAKRAKVFTKLIRELMTAARSGLPDPDMNPRLRAAIIAGRKENMPKDTIDRAIKRGAGGEDGTNYEEIRYEGYGPGGIAIIVEALTDNRNRTAPDIRAAFSKAGGVLGETGSVSFMFEHVGRLVFKSSVADADTMFEAALEAGAGDVLSDAEGHEVTCATNDFATVRDALIEKFGDPESAGFDWRPLNPVSVDEDTARSVLKLIDVLEDNDDVQRVASNVEVSDEILERLSA